MQRDNGIQGASRPRCAVCKLRRMKCNENCILAPFFPAQRSRELEAVYKVFGISNVEKMIKGLDEKYKKCAVDSLIWEAFCWQTDPNLGPYGEYRKLYDELKLYKSQCQQPPMAAMQQVFGQDGMVYKLPLNGEYIKLCDELKLYKNDQCQQPLMPVVQVFGQDGMVYNSPRPYGEYINPYEEPKLYRSGLGQQQPMPAMQGLGQDSLMYKSPLYGGYNNLYDISGQGQQQPMLGMQGFGQDGLVCNSPPSFVGWNGDNGISNKGSFGNEVNINNGMNYNHNSMVNSRPYSFPLKKGEDDLFSLPLQQNSISDLNPQQYCLPGQFSPINDKRI